MRTPGPQKTVLPNGVRVLVDPMGGVRSAAVGVWMFAGSRRERAAESGMTHFVEHMFFKGTRERDALALAQAFNAMGGQFNAFTTHEALCVHARVVDHHLPRALDLLGEMVLESAFADDEIERERNVVLEEIRMCNDMPEDRVVELFQKNLWAGHALGRPIMGTARAVR